MPLRPAVQPVGVIALASGALVDVDYRGVATPLLCSWLVLAPSGNPEPDFPSDCWVEVDCGARLYATQYEGGYTCENGHEHVPIEVAWAPFGPEWMREQEDRFAETGSYV